MPSKYESFNAKRREKWASDPLYRAAEYERRRRKSPENKAAVDAARYKNPNRIASRKLRDAVKCNKIIKPLTCDTCGSGDRIQGHHDDYDKPLEVKWLCHSCHMIIHGKIPRT